MVYGVVKGTSNEAVAHGDDMEWRMCTIRRWFMMCGRWCWERCEHRRVRDCEWCEMGDVYGDGDGDGDGDEDGDDVGM